MKNHKISNTSATTKAGEIISIDLKSLELSNFRSFETIYNSNIELITVMKCFIVYNHLKLFVAAIYSVPK